MEFLACIKAFCYIIDHTKLICKNIKEESGLGTYLFYLKIKKEYEERDE